jgi:hypothetical protein
MKKLGSALKVGLASAKFLKVLEGHHHEKNESSHRESERDDDADEMSPSKKSTFFFMGMDIPIEMTNSLK